MTSSNMARLHEADSTRLYHVEDHGLVYGCRIWNLWITIAQIGKQKSTLNLQNHVCCDGCNVWVHAECDKISSKLLKDLELTDYYCPDCKTKVNCKFAESRSSNSKMNSIENNQEHMIPGEVTVVCNGMEGIYIPNIHSVYAELERRVTFCKDMFMGAIFSGVSVYFAQGVWGANVHNHWFASRSSQQEQLAKLAWKMLSMAVQSNFHASSLKPFSFSSSNPSVTSIKPCVFTKPKPFSSNLFLTATPQKFRLSAAVGTVEESLAVDTEWDGISAETPPVTQKLGVEVKPTDKPRLVLKFIWMEKNIGIALDQMIPGHGTIPVSPYYFWPRKDAWEELKELLESKPWISQKQMIILLNQATDIINLWQQSGGNLV
ncbi:hypothetical protein K1719_032429 [Acacia pycnantha]|nr:hypothetical protein K1719_032429 [Acacia pycnantha]